MYWLTQNGNGALTTGSANECYAWIKKNTRFTVREALDTQGYELEKIPNGYCKHGCYVGGCGVDNMCGECETE